MLDTSITDAAFETELAERSRPRPRARRTCATCAHDGQCDGLPNCGGSCWEDALTECAQCGERFRYEDSDWEDETGHLFCSEACMEAWERDHAEEEDELEEEREVPCATKKGTGND